MKDNPRPRAQNGKGSKPRKVNKSQYDENYDKIFKKKGKKDKKK
jgi:hypothetical protein